MSRIHEALQKAAQEKTAQQAAGRQPDLETVTEDIPKSVLPTIHGSAATVRGTRGFEGGQSLRFEDLTKWCAHPEWKHDSRFSIFCRGSDDTRIGAERFRTLRSRLYQIAAVRPLRRVLVTSSVPDEGKTFIAANLALSIVRQSDKRALLIDADLRSPRAHETFGAPTNPGLTNYLCGEADEYDVIQQGAEPNFCFIPCGRPVSNPSELLSSERMKKLLDLVTPIFDWVILDSPPALPVHDASVLADSCDGVLFVVGAGKTNHEIAERGVSEFRNKNLLGVVLNRVDKTEGYGSYYGYPSKEK